MNKIRFSCHKIYWFGFLVTIRNFRRAPVLNSGISLRGVLGGTLAGIPSQGSSRGESWLEEPSQGSPRTPVVETLSCGRKGSLRKGGNLLWQARPPGLRAFPGLNGTLVPAPRESNFRNTSSSRGSRTLELRLQTQTCTYV